MTPPTSGPPRGRATREDVVSLPVDDRAGVVDGERTPHDVARIAPFDAVELDVGRLFPPEETAEG